MPHRGTVPLLDALQQLLAGLQVRMLEGRLLLDRPLMLDWQASSTLRGLTGHALTDRYPGVIRSWFKPGQSGHDLPAFLFQAAHDTGRPIREVAFRLIAWDPEGVLLEFSARALAGATGRPFGGRGTLVAACRLGEPERLVFSGAPPLAGPARLSLVTPVAVKERKAWLGPRELLLGHLVRAFVRRLNRLSAAFGNGGQLDETPWLAECALVQETDRQLRWISAQRRSTTQLGMLSLAGVAGTIGFAGLPASLFALLQAAEAFHVGFHTVHGCGQLRLEPTARPSPPAYG